MNVAVDQRIVRELQSRNQRLAVENYRLARKPIRPWLLVVGGLLLGGGSMATLIVLSGWL